MTHFVCYFNFKIDIEVLKRALSNVFSVKKNQVSELLDEQEKIKIKYEIINLSDTDERGYFIELNIYTLQNISKFVGIYNNLLLSIELNVYFNSNILINDESNDPFQWILVTKYRKVFLVEEKEFDNDFIVIKENRYELSLAKSLNLLPKDINFDKSIPYFVDNPSLWKKAQLPPASARL